MTFDNKGAIMDRHTQWVELFTGEGKQNPNLYKVDGLKDDEFLDAACTMIAQKINFGLALLLR
jgi:hypothetical protein